MSFEKIDIKNSYDSDGDNILTDFYVPVLSESISYRRLAGFFSSTSLAISAKGMAKFLRNNGRMKLICSARLSQSDVDAIKLGLENKEKIIEKNFYNEIKNITDDYLLDHIRALAFMVAHKLLDIKIAISITEENDPIIFEKVLQNGLFHQKVGIVEDEEHNILSFSGSENETYSSWNSNIEEFKVFRSWKESEKPYLNSDINKFEKYWNGNTKRTTVINLPDAIKEKMIEIAPNDVEKVIKKISLINTPTNSTKLITLWNHQIEAIEHWLENGKNGIFEMATGTGKTFTALGCVKEVKKHCSNLLTIIVAPYSHLLRQWKNDIVELQLEDKTFISDSSNSNWKNKLADILLTLNICKDCNIFILTTHNTFASHDFIEIIKKSRRNKILIVDEVHGIGSPERQNGLIPDYEYRLGLSATPYRWFDEDGTEIILNYFDKVVFEFTLDNAINTINPSTGKSYLTPYQYHPIFIELTEEEQNQYEDISLKIAKMFSKAIEDKEKKEIFDLLCMKRWEITKNANNKYCNFKELLHELGCENINHCLIYVSPEQIDEIQNILSSLHISFNKFTMEEKTVPTAEFSGLSEREYILKKFEDETYQALVAIKCLDEGVDIPAAETAIILASTSNPREWIQRRGRILRRNQYKNTAKIYDYIVLPFSYKNQITETIEKKIIDKELTRYKEFATIAENHLECLNILYDIEKQIGLY